MMAIPGRVSPGVALLFFIEIMFDQIGVADVRPVRRGSCRFVMCAPQTPLAAPGLIPAPALGVEFWPGYCYIEIQRQ
jgi:hypothetical protein